MNYELSDAQLNSLARDLDGLYDETQKKMGQEDLDYVRNVKRYSEAIKRRSFELFNHPDTEHAFQKAVVLRGLGANEFHSSFYKWDFVIDTDDWRRLKEGLCFAYPPPGLAFTDDHEPQVPPDRLVPDTVYL